MQIDYYYTLMSPWAYFGAPRFYALQKKYSFREEKICENFITDMVIKDNYYLLQGYSKIKLQEISISQ